MQILSSYVYDFLKFIKIIVNLYILNRYIAQLSIK